jgi:WD40 repeat protein
MLGWGNLVVFDVTTGKERLRVPASGNAVAWSPDGQRLAFGAEWTTGAGQTVEVWKLAGEPPVVRFSEVPPPLEALAWSPDGTRLAGAGKEKAIHLWDVATGQERGQLQGRGNILAAAWSPDGRLATTSTDGSVSIWDVSRTEEVLTLRGHTGPVYAAAWNPDGRRLATACEDETVRVWDTTEQPEARTLRSDSLTGLVALSWSTDGGQLFAANHDLGCVRAWGVDTGRVTHNSNGTPPDPVSPGAAFWGTGYVAWAPGGERLAIGTSKGNVWVRDLAGTWTPRTLTGHTGSVDAVAFSPDGLRLASGGEEGNVIIWDVESGEKQVDLHSGPQRIGSLAWSVDGKKLAAAINGTRLQVWDAATGRVLLSTPEEMNHDYKVVAWSPDGTRLAAASWAGFPESDGLVTVWDVGAGRQLAQMRGHTKTVKALAWTRDSRRVVSGSKDQTIKVWDVETGEEVLTLRGHTNDVNALAFSPDGTRLASAGDDRIVRIWEAIPEE